VTSGGHSALLRRYKARIEADCARRGVQYPWWIPTYASVASVGLAVVAVSQRGGWSAPIPVAGGLLALAPQLVWLALRRMLPMIAESAVVLAGTLVLIVDHPVSPDFAPFLLVVSAAEAAATSTVVAALVVGCVEMAALAAVAVAGRLDGGALYIVGVALGVDAGIALRWQMRALLAERAKRELAGEQAVLAERSRLAREVHDVVGHSLSISLLHIAGARRALAEHDLVDADEALQQAERVARSAMSDLRGSVARIAAGGAGNRPLPGAGDIAELVAAARQAGLDVRYEELGEITALPAGTGLGLYRIAQESLANIAKHAPGARSEVVLAAEPEGVRLVVGNALPDGPSPQVVAGAGLPGMATRAKQLGARFHAGPVEGRWVVDVAVPPERVRDLTAGHARVEPVAAGRTAGTRDG